MSYSCTVNNIHFDKVFINEVSKSTSKNVQFANGIPLQLSLTFKTICALPDTEELSTNMVRETYQTFFGVNISTSSISRMITDLKTLRLIEGIDNPFGSRRMAWIRLTENFKNSLSAQRVIGKISQEQLLIETLEKHVHIKKGVCNEQ